MNKYILFEVFWLLLLFFCLAAFLANPSLNWLLPVNIITANMVLTELREYREEIIRKIDQCKRSA